MIQLYQGWVCAKSAMIRRLTASSYPVDMPELVKDVLPESRTRVNLVPTVGKVSRQLIAFICNILCTNSQIHNVYFSDQVTGKFFIYIVIHTK